EQAVSRRLARDIVRVQLQRVLAALRLVDEAPAPAAYTVDSVEPKHAVAGDDDGERHQRAAARRRARSASRSRSRGAAEVTSSSSRREEASTTASTARANASSFARDGFENPLILRTYWSAAARTSSS